MSWVIPFSICDPDFAVGRGGVGVAADPDPDGLDDVVLPVLVLSGPLPVRLSR